MTMTRDQNGTVLDIIQVAIETNWLALKAGLEEMGYSMAEVTAAVQPLADREGRDNPLGE